MARTHDAQPSSAGGAGPAKGELDFIVIGAQKAGTTTLFEHLRRHPDVSLPAGKESAFFSQDENYRRGWDAYLEGLAREGGMSGSDRRWGTISPSYMLGTVQKRLGEGGSYDEHTVPRRIAEQLPDVRLVAILRDPVARAISHHGMLVRRGGELRSFDEVVERLLRPDALRAARTTPTENASCIVRGEYGRILGGYLDVFARERLLILFTDELERAPVELLERLYGFLALRGDFIPDTVGDRYFATVRAHRPFDLRRPRTWLSPSSPVSPQGLQRGMLRIPGSKALWRALPTKARRRLWEPYAHLASRARAVNRRGAAARQTEVPPRPETIARLREHYAADAERLAGMLGGHAPYWVSRPEVVAERT